jgi:Zn-dependent M28 family amino/carboxypeptidase
LNLEGASGVPTLMNARRRVLVAGLFVLSACTAVAPASVAPSASEPAAATPTTTVEPSTGSVAPELATDVDRLRDDLEALQAAADAHDGIRATGTEGYEASVAHVTSVLSGLGFEVEQPEVPFISFRELPGTRLEVDGTVIEGSDELRALIYSAGGDVSGPVAVLEGSGCDPADFDGVPEGAIALTTQGGCFRRDQAVNAGAAGIAALLVGYPGRGPGEIFRPTLIDPGAIEIPVVSVTDATVNLLLEARQARLVVETERLPSSFTNVVAQLGSGPSVVMLGAHLDSVLDGPGINDNGSGVAALLEIARGVADRGVPPGWAVRIGLWGGEEFGTIGSRAYASEVGDEVTAYLNLDMTGSVAGANLVYDEAGAAAGSEAISTAFGAWFAERGLEATRIDLGGSSDQFGFMQAGIPTGGLFAGATESGSAAQPGAGAGGEAMDPCYHIACDTLDNVDLDRVATFAAATFAVTYGLMQP